MNDLDRIMSGLDVIRGQMERWRIRMPGFSWSVGFYGELYVVHLIIRVPADDPLAIALIEEHGLERDEAEEFDAPLYTVRFSRTTHHDGYRTVFTLTAAAPIEIGP